MKNDQEEIINAIKNKKYSFVWDKIKHIGNRDVCDEHQRYLIFFKAIHDFDYTMNNNFILFYKKYLKFLNFEKYKTFYVSTNKNMIQKLKNQSISPEEKRTKSKFKDLNEWI